MTRRRSRKKLVAEINVVPYIDVMLVLLVIFMVTTPLLNQGVEIDLPKAQADLLNDIDGDEPIVLSVNKEGVYFLNKAQEPTEPQNETQIRATVGAILSRNPTLPVLVQADQAVAYGTVMSAMVLLQASGAPKVGLSTQIPEN